MKPQEQIQALIKGGQMERLERSINFSASQVASEVESILSAERGYNHEQLTKVFADIQLKSRQIAKKARKKGFVGNFIDTIMNGREKLLTETKSLKSQIEGVDLLIEDQLTLIEERLPQMQDFYSHFSGYNKALVEDVEIAEQMEEALKSSIELMELDLEANPKLALDYEFQLALEEQRNELKRVESKIQQINIQRGFFYHMSQDMLNSIDVAKQLKNLLNANKETLLPMFRFTAVSSVINRELQQGIDTVKVMREGFTTIFKETAEQNISNMIRTSEIAGEGILEPEMLIELANKMEQAQKQIAENEKRGKIAAQKRREASNEYVKKMAGLNTSRSKMALETLSGEESKLNSIKEVLERL